MVTARDVQRRRVPYGVAVQPDSEPIEVAKTRLRTSLLAARRARTETDRRAARGATTTHVVRALAGATCIAAYLPLSTEPLDPATLNLLAVNSRVLVPVVTGASPLEWGDYPARDSPRGSRATRRGALGIDEPTGPRLGPAAIADVDAILVPALAVDRDGHRLGRGGGHYDRTLALLSRQHSAPLPVRIALIYDDELLEAVPFGEYDQLVTAVVTPGSGLSQLGC
jgi:5-formyltetrahydrofolate cyclo-ligase